MTTMTAAELRAAGHDPYNLTRDEHLLIPLRHLSIVEGFVRHSEDVPPLIDASLTFLHECLGELEALRSDLRVAVAKDAGAHELLRPRTVTERLAEVEG